MSSTQPDVAGETAVQACSTSHAADFPSELLIWLTPAFPVGGFAYSQGLEQAIEAGLVGDEHTLKAWLADICAHGALKSDLTLLALT